ncbi:MAG: CDP-diacylglycerol--serine O-phosphatidyltransferase [Chloroflexota bacterium]|nr:CDP-diacylglycerol--serine O-phosphatidyltransferase [Lentimicrobium sp.]
MNIRSHVPNAVTLLNLLSGSLSIILLFKGYIEYSALCVGLSAVFDFLDGFFAKLFNVKSFLGKELDSLADVISFGLAPALFLFYLMSNNEYIKASDNYLAFTPYLALFIAAFSALRLAKFNLDTRQTVSFLGLPTPANAVFFVSLVVVALQKENEIPFLNEITGSLWVQLIVIPLSCYLLISEIPMFALKFTKGYGLKNNMLRYSFLTIALLCIFLFDWSGILLSVIIYIGMSLIFGDR